MAVEDRAPERRAPFASAVLLAAGGSTRMASAGEAPRKPFLRVGGRTVLERAASALLRARLVRELVVVAREEDLERARELLAAAGLAARLSALVPGGAERTDSVRAGVAACDPASEVLLVHDAARPFVRPERVDALARAALESGAALLATPVRDTIKRARAELAVETLERAELWAAHTPQGMRAALFRDLLERAAAEGFRPTDDAALHERYIGPARLVPDEPTNLKLTTLADLTLAEALARILDARGGA